MEKQLPNRKHPRLKLYDYSQSGMYFITICTQNRRCILSRVVGRGLAPAAEIQLTEYGKIAEQQLLLLEKRYSFLKIDKYVIMPNHIHMIIVFDNQTAGARGVPRSEQSELWGFRASPRPTIMDVICAYKSLTTGKCKKFAPIDKLFQTSFYEHIVRNYDDYIEIKRYIQNNHLYWEQDKLYNQE